MADHRSAPPLHLAPRPSTRLAALVLSTHAAALAAALALPGAWRLLAVPVVLSLVYHWLVQVLRRAPWSIRSATWGADGSWLLVLRSGREVEARLAPATFVSVPLVVLDFRWGRLGRAALPVFADAVDADTLRRLRVRLRLEGARRDRRAGA